MMKLKVKKVTYIFTFTNTYTQFQLLLKYYFKILSIHKHHKNTTMNNIIFTLQFSKYR